MILMKFQRKNTASLTLSLLMTGSAFALGLGNVSGQAILGQPLSIEISLLGGDEAPPSVECFRIRHPMAEIDSAFVLRNTRIQLLGERGRAKLLVTTATPVREPIVEFGVAVACGYELSRDYLLLASEPTKTTAPVLPIMPPAMTLAERQIVPAKQVRLSEPGMPVAPADQWLRVEKDDTLEALAQQNYPLQPKARAKYLRMMAQANPHLVSGAEPIPAGSELRIPPGLPLRRHGSYATALQAKAAATNRRNSLGAVRALPRTSPKSRAAPGGSGQDLLVLGAATQRSASELLAEAERLTELLMAQTNAQNAAVDKITQLEATLDTLKKQVSGLENRVNTIEAARQAEKLANQSVSLDIVELLLAILAGGAIGGLSLQAYNRFRSRRSQGATPAASTPGSEIQCSHLATSAQSGARLAGLPWEKNTDSAGQATKPPMTAPTTQESLRGDLADLATGSPAAPQEDFDFLSTKPR